MSSELRLDGKRIVLGVTGGIAAYKAAELTRLLRGSGAEVQVVMTEAATAFVGPLTFQALSGRPVRTRLIDAEAEAAMGHIELARWADAIVVAPATADFMARFAHGRADDLLAALCLAAEVPVALAPAMNHAMWSNPATVANRGSLADRGIALWGPAAGDQACGEVGEGRMLEPAELAERVGRLVSSGSLAGLHALITAGPTREPLDPVRFIANRSSGRMGFALAQAAAAAGARVTLVSGPSALTAGRGIERVDVETAAQMYEAVMARLDACDVFVAAAAVADYRPHEAAAQKMKKRPDTLSLMLEPTQDILAAAAAREPRPFVVGFAAETENVSANAEAKRQSKGLDMVVANRVGPDEGFEVADNAAEVLWEGGGAHLAKAPKTVLASELIELIARRYEQTRKGRAQDPRPAPRS